MTTHNISPQDTLRDFWDTLLSDSEPPSDDFSSLLHLLDVDTDKFFSLSTNQKWYQIKKYATLESLPKHKLNTLITKLRSSPTDNSLVTKFLVILDLLMTSIELSLKPFWKESTKVLSDKLWLPTETGSVDSGSNSFNTSLTTLKKRSWFSIKKSHTVVPSSLMTSAQLLPMSRLQSIENKHTKVLRSRKLRLFLTSNQKTIFNKWLGTSRFIYNKTIERINSNSKGVSKSKLRTEFVTNIPKDEPWQSDTPQGIREGAVFDACDAFDSNMKKFKKTRIPFVLGYRKKKAPSQTMNLPVDSLKSDFRLYPKFLGNNSIILVYKSEKEKTKFRTKTTNKMIPKLGEDGKPLMKDGKVVKEKSGSKINGGQILEHEIKIQRTRLGKWYMLIPYEMEVSSSDNQGAIIALDPGVRTFLTGYSPNGEVLKFGDDDIKRIRNYMLKTDILQSKINKLKGHKKHRSKKAFQKRLEKMQNWIKDCHRKVVKYLVDNYDVVIIPVFNSKSMCKKDGRKIQSSTVRNMMGWAHGKFRSMLISKILGMKNKRILLPSEEYTSKTCGRCGELHQKLGGAKVYKCGYCGLKSDRDIHASRNLLLKTLTALEETVMGSCRTLGPLLGD